MVELTATVRTYTPFAAAGFLEFHPIAFGDFDSREENPEVFVNKIDLVNQVKPLRGARGNG